MKNEFKPNNWYRSTSLQNWLCYMDFDGNTILFVNDAILVINIKNQERIFYKIDGPKNIIFNW